MKILSYYSLLLILIGLLSWFVLHNPQSSMSMGQMVSISVLLGLYVVGLSFVGEGPTVDERDTAHRYFSNRIALVGGTIVLSVGVLYQLFTHTIDYWLLAGLISINILKIVSLIYSNYKR